MRARKPVVRQYTMRFPTDLFSEFNPQYTKLVGFAYDQLLGCFMEDCVKRMSVHAPELFDYDEDNVMTVCLS